MNNPKQEVLRLGAVLATVFLLGACATPPEDPEALAAWKEANDPLEPMNRAIFGFNKQLDRFLIRPLAEGYVAVVPARGRKSVRSFLDNLRSPVILLNDVLQGESKRAGDTLGRMLINTTVGIGGLFDVAGAVGLEFHDEDFGQTLAVWGVGEGPYLVLPVFGPSNPRDTVGMVADGFADPLNIYLSNTDREWAILTRSGIDGIDKRAQVLDALDEIERTALDFYATIRSLYRQRRVDEIKNGPGVEEAPGPSIISETDQQEAPTAAGSVGEEPIEMAPTSAPAGESVSHNPQL